MTTKFTAAAEATIAAAFTEAYTNTKAFEVDSKGRTIRTDRAGHGEVRHFLINRRVVDTIEILEEVGSTAFDALVSSGHLKRDSAFNRFRENNLYWVTEKAQSHYDLPRKIKMPCGFEVGYAR